MARKKEDTSPYSRFFKEESQEFLQKSTGDEDQVTYSQKKVPTIPMAEPLDESEVKRRWKSLHKFFNSSQGGKVPKGAIPVHISPYFLKDGTLTNYPVWISKDLNSSTKSDSGDKCSPLSSLLADQINELYPDPGQGKMIRKVLSKLVLEAGLELRGNGTSDFMEVFEKASISLGDKLNLRGGDKEIYEEQIQTVKNKLPEKGTLVPYSSKVTFEILHTALLNVSLQARQDFISRIHRIIQSLMDILQIESQNDPESTDPQHLKSSLDFADTYLDFNRLSKVIPESASEHISKERLQRIKSVIETLTMSEELLSVSASVILASELDKTGAQIGEIFGGSEVIAVEDQDSCSRSLTIYEARLAEFINAIKALRIGELEMKNNYVSELHDEAFSSFDQYSFSEEEISFLPPVILITRSSSLVNKELNDFMDLLHRNIPINIIALRSTGEDASVNAIDTASLAVSYRNTYVAQLTSLDPQLVYRKFEEGLSANSSALFHIETAQTSSDNDALVELSASIESRDFPEFVYNGKIGTAWGSRFDIKDNPQNQQDWPVYEYKCNDGQGNEIALSVPFTYADFAVLKPQHRSEFRNIEPEIWTENLVLLSEYLLLSNKDRYGKIPFIWMIEEKQLLKVAVSWKMVMVSGEKKDFWNYLQDCGGVHSYHAEKAVLEQEQKIREEADEEIARLKAEHAAELQKVKEDSAKDAMENLTAALLDIDIDMDAVVTSPPTKAAPTPSSEEHVIKEPGIEDVADEAEIPPEVEEEEDLISAEPWIETPLCTTCNECTDINKRMFNYNSDKQAFVADPRAGTFAQLVEAAEKCPVKIIHPGKPLNPNEPGLEDLIERAEKFN